MITTATAVAHPNIAPTKYWDKHDEAVQLPTTDSPPLALGIALTATTVSLIGGPSITADSGISSGQEIMDKDLSRVQKFLDLVHEHAGSTSSAEVNSTNEIPTGTGLAPSAPGFGALTLTTAKAYGLDYIPEQLSALARRGSDSVYRSIFGGLIEWLPGDDNASNHTVALSGSGLDLSLVVAVLAPGRKRIDSCAAMCHTVETSPFFPAWVEQVPRDTEDMKAAIAATDFTTVSELAEANAMRMYATILGALPPVRYWNPDSVVTLDLVATLRDEGIKCYTTTDAGPNAKVLRHSGGAETIANRFRAEFEGVDVLVSGSGPGAYLVQLGG